MAAAAGTPGFWTRPIAGSAYPVALAPEGEDPGQSFTRLLGGVMVVMTLLGFVIVVPLVTTAVTWLGYQVDRPGTDWAAYQVTAQGFGTVWGVLAAHLGLSAMLLVVWAFFHFLHHRPLAWLWSVTPGVRWGYAGLCTAVAVVVIGAVAAYNWVVGPGWHPPVGWGWYVVVIVATTPFQALAEEVMFRGYLLQAFGALWRNQWFPIVATAVVFALFHGTQNLWLFSSRLMFGLLAGVLVWRTGGLEAGVAIHVVNNLFAFGVALFSGTLPQVRTATAVGAGQALSDVGMFALSALACWGIAVALKLRRTVQAVAE